MLTKPDDLNYNISDKPVTISDITTNAIIVLNSEGQSRYGYMNLPHDQVLPFEIAQEGIDRFVTNYLTAVTGSAESEHTHARAQVVGGVFDQHRESEGKLCIINEVYSIANQVAREALQLAGVSKIDVYPEAPLETKTLMILPGGVCRVTSEIKYPNDLPAVLTQAEYDRRVSEGGLPVMVPPNARKGDLSQMFTPTTDC